MGYEPSGPLLVQIDQMKAPHMKAATHTTPMQGLLSDMIWRDVQNGDERQMSGPVSARGMTVMARV